MKNIMATSADVKWHGISRMLGYSTEFKWNILLRWHGIESSILVKYSNILLFSKVAIIAIGYVVLHILSRLHNRAKLIDD